MLPLVVIAGRPNVGKSSLFNRLVGRRLALVADTPGVTRDRKEADALVRGRQVRFVDTAGLEEAAPESLPGRMAEGASAATAMADLVLFVVDARAGMTPADPPVGAVITRCPRAFSSEPASAAAETMPIPRLAGSGSAIAFWYTSPALVFSFIGPGRTPCGAARPVLTVACIAPRTLSRIASICALSRPEMASSFAYASCASEMLSRLV